jgi:hypothetical protein
VDFGIAKTIAARHQTQAGALKGKMAYMAPEAVRGRVVDRRCDVFSAGVMLWELLAGRRFWDSAGDSGIAMRLAAGTPPPPLPSDLDVPDGLRVVCARALAMDPMDRYQTAAELAADLEMFGADTSESHARSLGRLVSSVFDAEREQRRALIEGHLRSASAPPSSPQVVAPTRTAVPARAAPGQRWLGLTPRITARALIVTAAIVLIFAGYVRSRQGRLASFPWDEPTASAAGVVPPSPPLKTPAAARTAVIEPLPRPAAAAREGREDRRARHRPRGHRARPLDLLSDDVLDLDGEPLRAPPGSRVTRASND